MKILLGALILLALGCGSESSVTVSQDQQVGDDNDINCNTCSSDAQCEEVGCFDVPIGDDESDEIEIALDDSEEGAL